MNEHEDRLRDALRQLTDALPVGEAPDLDALHVDDIAATRGGGRRWATLVAAAVLVGVSVGAIVLLAGDDDPGGITADTADPVATTSPDTTPRPTSADTTATAPPGDMTSPCPPTDAELREKIAVAKEGGFAFAGTVMSVEMRVHPDASDPELTLPQDDERRRPIPWVTFDVARWYTQDWGTTFSVFMPGLIPEVGQTWRLGGNAYGVYMDDFEGQSGEVDPCFAGPDDDAGRSLWDEEFDGSVIAGAGEPEGEPDPAVLAELRAARDRWHADEPNSYSVIISWTPSPQSQTTGEACSPGSGGTFRVVVIDGVATEAVDTYSLCRIDPAMLPTVGEMFDEAIRFAGATEFTFDVSTNDGNILNYYAHDRSVEAGGGAYGLSMNRSPALVGWEEVEPALSSARQRWESNEPTSYQLRIGTGGGMRIAHDVVARVDDGEVTSLRVNGEPTDPSTLELPWQPYMVDHVFDLFDEQGGEGNIVAVFDPDSGVPTEVWFDPIVRAIDDELYVEVSVEPG